jgi:threonylcarbamoyladenosine tRNA methylthiotransferase CDKAL1
MTAAVADIEDLDPEGDARGDRLLKAHVRRVGRAVRGAGDQPQPHEQQSHSPLSLPLPAASGGGAGRSISIVPDTQRIWVKTWGCSHNSSDSEYMAGQLADYGFQ